MKKILSFLLIAICCGGCSASDSTNGFAVGDYVGTRDFYDTCLISNGIEMPGLMTGYGFIFGIRQIKRIATRPSTGEPIAQLDGNYRQYWFTLDSLYHVSAENAQNAKRAEEAAEAAREAARRNPGSNQFRTDLGRTPTNISPPGSVQVRMASDQPTLINVPQPTPPPVPVATPEPTPVPEVRRALPVVTPKKWSHSEWPVASTSDPEYQELLKKSQTKKSTKSQPR